MSSLRRIIVLGSLALAPIASGCGPATPGPSVAGAGSDEVIAIMMEPTQGLLEEEVAFDAAGVTVHGTLSRPEGEGRHAAMLLIAGSGPTDRDWNNALLPGTNGSGRLLARELSKRGVVVLRYDKRGTGATGVPETTTMADYLAEQHAGLALLRAQASVDPARVFVAGHSEGGLHALRVVADAGGPLAGLLLLSAPGHSMADTMIRQVTEQFAGAVAAGQTDQATADAEVQRLTDALGDVMAGNDVAPEHVPTIPGIAMLVQAVAAAGARGLAQELLAFDPAAAIGGLRLPILILNGDKDLQVRPDIDAQTLRDAAAAGGVPDLELVVVPNADHVYKRQETPFEQLGPEAAIGYNADDRSLEPAVVAGIVTWLQRVTAAP